MSLFYLLYEPLLAIFGLFYLPHLILRLKQAPDHRRLLRERWGHVELKIKAARIIWIHAVSVGEVMAAKEFIRLLQMMHPETGIVISTTTPTGQKVAQPLAGPMVQVVYFPFDFSSSVKRALQSIRPACLIMMETEIWPNIIRWAEKMNIPIGIMNGRISDRAFRRYQWVKHWMGQLLPKLAFCLVSNKKDQERFLSLGLPASKVQLTGNMKFDIEGVRNPIQVERLKARWQFEGKQVWVAGSTHEGEEALVLKVFSRLKPAVPNLVLVLAPRHPERTAQVKQLTAQTKYHFALADEKVDASPDIVILNVMGELSNYFGLADLVFMGGSLIEHGGQNPIEPARERKGILHGPHVSNFQSVYEQLDRAGGAVMIHDEETMYSQAEAMLHNREAVQTMGLYAFGVVEALKGASLRNLRLLEPWLNSSHVMNESMRER
ncbi:MAG: hypothetical protein COV74_08050 [Candidatus Omnitrophica bacterium CG11_big_fil_rev_8_21_14_0_20_45_26]|uniref:3-deoxy-D-manno-octulosonic acid transferase n=1 Tax=Candidatus Abzuiibacterium crystallinum TaxID=1974748 RepID=A0A2H0LMH8_9BACT|nr:MAG: hypothetical protein COV74_08050 [Candidatus Omnitrophica bacterium CG11_big_fil_rev_8_21_14_0_20_45_26]PIW65171.1 MAG: hypothetical protein COW12_03090 [Candidatus Omnitrophica bacterium CG12_big_fil_rev_8_21_14_0_65_45_16]